MNRAILIGDVHASVDDLEDCERLAGIVLEACVQEKPGFVVFLGDLYNAFAVKNVVVERWWLGFLRRLSAKCPNIWLLVGNHDRPGDSSQVAHSLQAHVDSPGVHVVEAPTTYGDDILLLPFYFKAEDFVAAANQYSAKTVLCHQSFLGGHYESKQPIEARHDASAVDAAAIPQRCIISGHIHESQTFSKVWYVGAPRSRNNVSDANQERYIHAIDFEGGLPKAVRKYSTSACRQIWHVEDTEGLAVSDVPPGKAGDRYVVDITGSAAYIEARKKVWAVPGIRLRCYQTDRPGPKLSESGGIPAAWSKWAEEFKPKHGTSMEMLRQLAGERITL